MPTVRSSLALHFDTPYSESKYKMIFILTFEIDKFCDAGVYRHLKLPPLKLTQLPVEGNTRIIHRGLSKPRPEDESGDTEPLLCEDMLDMPSPDDLVEPSHHELQSKASIKGWEQLRSKVLSVHTECSAMPRGQLCLLCPEPAEFRCQECGPVSYYCKECLNLLHEKANLFHTPEQWEVMKYSYMGDGGANRERESPMGYKPYITPLM